MHDTFSAQLCWLGGAIIASTICGALARRMHQPRVLGIMIGGIIINILFGWTAVLHDIQSGHAETIRSLAEIAAMFLLFQAGLEGNLHSIMKDARTGWKVAFIGILFPIMGGYLYTRYAIETSLPVALFQGGVFAATSVGITAAVLSELGVLQKTYARTIISAAVIDDVLGLIVLAVCLSMNTPGEMHIGVILKNISFALLFVCVIPVAGHIFAPKIISTLNQFDPNAREAIIIGWMLIYGAGALYAGLAAIVGAYFAGVALEEVFFTNGASSHEKPVEHFVQSMIIGFSPVFFMYAVCVVDPNVFIDPAVLINGLIFTMIAMAGKMVCGIFAEKGEWLHVGIGMCPRGEVGIIFATIGLNYHILSQELFGASMIMVLLTTLFTPPILGMVIRKPQHRLSVAA